MKDLGWNSRIWYLNLIKQLFDNKKQNLNNLLLSVTSESVIKKYINHYVKE